MRTAAGRSLGGLGAAHRRSAGSESISGRNARRRRRKRRWLPRAGARQRESRDLDQVGLSLGDTHPHPRHCPCPCLCGAAEGAGSRPRRRPSQRMSGSGQSGSGCRTWRSGTPSLSGSGSGTRSAREMSWSGQIRRFGALLPQPLLCCSGDLLLLCRGPQASGLKAALHSCQEGTLGAPLGHRFYPSVSSSGL